MTMADRIKERRKAMNMTQEELAERLGLQKSAIAKYENGRVQNIKRPTIAKMADILECSPAYLMALDEDAASGARPNHNPIATQPPALSPEESALLEDYRVLNDTGQQEATKRVHELTLIPSYVEVRFLGHQKEDNDIIPLAAHHAPGVTGAEDEAVDEVERLRRKYEKED